MLGYPEHMANRLNHWEREHRLERDRHREPRRARVITPNRLQVRLRALSIGRSLTTVDDDGGAE